LGNGLENKKSCKNQLTGFYLKSIINVGEVQNLPNVIAQFNFDFTAKHPSADEQWATSNH
jgi:hypothetical protein